MKKDDEDNEPKRTIILVVVTAAVCTIMVSFFLDIYLISILGFINNFTILISICSTVQW